MPTGNPELQHFKKGGHHDRNRRNESPPVGIGEAKRDADQDEGESVLAVMPERGVRPKLGRAERREGDGGSEGPGDELEKGGGHPSRLARIVGGAEFTPPSDERVVTAGG